MDRWTGLRRSLATLAFSALCACGSTMADANGQPPPSQPAADAGWTDTLVAPSFRKSEKAVGGDRARPGEWPFLGVLRGVKAGELTYYCGATAISPDWLLTAAHCLEGTAPAAGGVNHPAYGPIEIVIGVQDLSQAKPSDLYRATRVIIHGDYRAEGAGRGAASDIALIRLDRPWKGAVARLSAGEASDPDGVFGRSFIAGFGRVTPFSLEMTRFQSPSGPALAYSPFLMHAMLPAKAPESCVNDYRVNGYEPKLSICAGFDAGGIDSCQGDSGGPLGALDSKGRLYQVGIVSHGYKCGVARSPAVYTRVSAFMSFILQNAPDAKFVAAERESAFVATQETLGAIIAALKPSIDRMTISSTPATTEFKVGDIVQFSITSRVPGRIWVLDVDKDNNIQPVYPNPNDPPLVERTFVKANETLSLPRFRAKPPLGRSRLIAIVLPPNVELIGDGIPRLDVTKGPPILIAQDYAMRLLNQITQATGLGRSGGDVSTWSAGEVSYSVSEAH